VDLTEIEGIDVGTALVVLAEIGVDVSRFPTRSTSRRGWGLCPNTSRSNPREKKTLAAERGESAETGVADVRPGGRSDDDAAGLFYRRSGVASAGWGPRTATAHQLARLVYRMLK